MCTGLGPICMTFALSPRCPARLPAKKAPISIELRKQMSGTSTQILQSILKVLHHTGLARVLEPVASGRGIIFMLHQVGPDEDAGFSPNRILKVSPEFLDQVITLVKRSGFDIISLDDVPARLRAGKCERRFACFTLDDGYRDNIEYAYPVFKRHRVPFTIYLPTDFADGKGDLWWLVLEHAISKTQSISVPIDGEVRTFATRTQVEKDAAFSTVYWWLRAQPEDEARRHVKAIADDAGYDPAPLCSDLVMNWDQAKALDNDPLVTFGGHTCSHMALAKLSLPEARREVAQSVTILEKQLGKLCRHFSYPYGDERSAGEREFELLASLGLETAVTTQKGHVHAHHAECLTALPRVSLNGDYQDIRFVQVFLTGVPFALWRGLAAIRSVLAGIRGRHKSQHDEPKAAAR